MNLIATRPFKHRGKKLQAGDAFSAHPVIGEAYKRTGYASESEDANTEGGEQAYETRVMTAAMPAKRGRGRPRKTEPQ